MSNASHVSPPPPPPINNNLPTIDEKWLHENARLVQWNPPLYKDGVCWQDALVQGINSAGRPDKSMWYVAKREGPCGSFALANSFSLYISDKFQTREKAIQHLEQLPNRPTLQTGWRRNSPCLNEFRMSPMSTAWMGGLDETTANQALKQKHAVCVQAKIKGEEVVYAWTEACTGFLQIFSPSSNCFLDETPLASNEAFQRLSVYLRSVLTSRPNVFIIGQLSRERGSLTLFIYDAVQFPQSGDALAMVPVRAEFAQRPLIDRLMHLQAILQTEKRDYVGDCVMLAPFQPAFTRKDMRMHTEIFIDSCGFPGVIRRLSGASES